jgi:hypothetical protein
VFIVEGEKDVDRLRAEGLVATCNAFGGGKGKWTRGHSKYLRARHVVVLPDNDPTGAEHGRCVAMALLRVAASVRLLALPGLPAKGDVSDWLDGHTIDELRALALHSPGWTPRRDKLPEPRLREEDDDWYRLREGRRSRRRIYALSLPHPHKLLLLMLTDLDGQTQDELAVFMRLTPRRVRQLIADLRRDGHLQTKRGYGDRRRRNLTIGDTAK